MEHGENEGSKGNKEDEESEEKGRRKKRRRVEFHILPVNGFLLEQLIDSQI